MWNHIVHLSDHLMIMKADFYLFAIITSKGNSYLQLNIVMITNNFLYLGLRFCRSSSEAVSTNPLRI